MSIAVFCSWYVIIKNNVGFHAKQVLLAKLLLNILAKKILYSNVL